MRKLGKFGMLFLVAVLALGSIVAAGAYFDDMTKDTLTTTNAKVEIGTRTGFPMDFDNLTPCVWTDWQAVTIASASTIDMDVYIGLQDKGIAGGADLKDMLDVQIQRWVGASWVTVYDNDVSGLFAAWQKMADNMPASTTDTYQVRLHLSELAENDLQGGWTKVWVLIYGVQWNVPDPTGTPWDYSPLP